jgi:hypothetical protein
MARRSAGVDAWEELGERPVPVTTFVPVGVAVRRTATGCAARVSFGGIPIEVTARTRAGAIRAAERAASAALARFLAPEPEPVRDAG